MNKSILAACTDGTASLVTKESDAKCEAGVWKSKTVKVNVVARARLKLTMNCLRDFDSGFFLKVYT